MTLNVGGLLSASSIIAWNDGRLSSVAVWSGSANSQAAILPPATVAIAVDYASSRQLAFRVGGQRPWRRGIGQCFVCPTHRVPRPGKALLCRFLGMRGRCVEPASSPRCPLILGLGSGRRPPLWSRELRSVQSVKQAPRSWGKRFLCFRSLTNHPSLKSLLPGNDAREALSRCWPRDISARPRLSKRGLRRIACGWCWRP